MNLRRAISNRRQEGVHTEERETVAVLEWLVPPGYAAVSTFALVDCRRERFDMIRAARSGRQGGTRKHTGRIRPRSNAAGRSVPAGGCCLSLRQSTRALLEHRSHQCSHRRSQVCGGVKSLRRDRHRCGFNAQRSSGHRPHRPIALQRLEHSSRARARLAPARRQRTEQAFCSATACFQLTRRCLPIL